MRSQLFVISAVAVCRHAVALDEETQANPIRKVVNLLQGMQKKVMAEGEREKELYEKFMCYCKTGGSDLSASIQAAEAKVPSVTASIEAATQKLAQTKADLKQAQIDRTSAKKAMEEGTAIREREAAAYASEKAEHDTNIAAVNKAVTAVEKGMGGFLQTQAAQVLRVALAKQDMVDGDRQELAAFLSGTHGEGYAPASGEVTGILKQLGETMAKTLADLTADEKSAISSHEGLMGAKTKETAALTSSIETKTKQVGDLGVQLVQMENDLQDTQAALAEDQAFSANLEKSCSTKTAEWEERQKTRADELVALGDTIKILNDDDALDLFKKTLPGASASASFVQVSSSAAIVRDRALEAIHQAHDHGSAQDRSGLDFLVVALSGKKSLGKGGFDKVIKMIDNMVGVLKQEQIDDDNKKEYCGIQLDQTDDKKKTIARSIQEAENGIATSVESIATLKEEIKSLEAGIRALDKSVAEATDQRKAENIDYKDLMAGNGAAKELLAFAKNRLNKFYNPKLHKAAPKRELSAGDRIYENQGGDIPTDAPGGIAGTGIGFFAQISSHNHHKDAPAPPPETWGAYQSKSGESGGVMAMIGLLVKDLDKEMTESESDEKHSQASYETMMKESAEKRATDSKSHSGKVSNLADTESELLSLKEDKQSAGSELMALTKYIASLHSECDWLLQYHDVRKEARSEEIDSLTKAKAVLSGADFAMVQTRAKGFLGH